MTSQAHCSFCVCQLAFCCKTELSLLPHLLVDSFLCISDEPVGSCFIQWGLVCSVMTCFDAQITSNAASGSPFKPPPISFFIRPSILKCFCPFWKRKLQFHRVLSLTQPQNELILQRALVPFSGEWDLEAKVWALGALIFPAGLLLPLPTELEPDTCPVSSPVHLPVSSQQVAPSGSLRPLLPASSSPPSKCLLSPDKGEGKRGHKAILKLIPVLSS